MAQIEITNEVTESFMMKNGLKQEDRMPSPISFNILVYYHTIVFNYRFYCHVQTNILGRSRMAVNNAYRVVEKQVAIVGLNINNDKTNAVIQTREQLRIK